MDVASLVLGIISIVLGFIPLCGAIAFIPALVGLILGIIVLVKKSKDPQAPKGMSIAGVALNSLAILFIFFWIFVIAASS